MKSTQHIILYFDVLGYSEVSLKADDNYLSSIYELLKSVTERIHGHIKPHTTELIGYNTKAYNYTDNFCVVFEALDEIAISHCTALAVFYAAQVQSFLAHGGVFCRGCIIKDNIVAYDNFLQGQGTVKAHFYEAQIAIYPRIIVEKELVDALESIDRSHSFGKLDCEYTDIFASMFDFCFMDGDGHYIVDYLRYSNDLEKDNSILEYHKKYILLILYSVEAKSRIFDKYIWALMYHNTNCEFLGKDEYSIDISKIFIDLRIDEKYVLQTRATK